ncbi:hypothetical protein TrCOL_g1680 [Triparma columacea]|uniref:cGMP-dependent protein kinase n=1 Tax=Triparma columacea TaxID=722753 RepID=A0A9W7LDP2_9STRA|nr:hypothetical protein TrCOL_g1680 [Triparma columacea]
MGGGASVHSPATPGNPTMLLGGEASYLKDGIRNTQKISGMDPPPSRPPGSQADQSGMPSHSDNTHSTVHGIVHLREESNSGNVRPKLRQRKAGDGKWQQDGINNGTNEGQEGKISRSVGGNEGRAGGEVVGGATSLPESNDDQNENRRLVDDDNSNSTGMRSHSTSKNRQLYSTGLSDFLSKHVLGDKESFAISPSFQRKSEAATLAMKMALDHFMFEGTQSLIKQMFIQELEEENLEKGSVVCRQGEPGDKLYIVESGTIAFHIGGAQVGEQKSGGVFGELSLVYGIGRSATAICVTDCVLWSLGLVSFRRIQSCLAMEALENSYRSAQRTLSGLTKEEVDKAEWKRSDVKFEDIEKISLLGKGTFGCVFLAKQKDQNNYFALKELSKANLVNARQGLRAVSERNALRACDSFCVIKLYETFSTRDSLYFLTEIVQGGDLMSYMIEQGTLEDDIAIFFSACISEAIHHIHTKGFVHRDIKPENCLISQEGYLKVADLGLAKRLPAVVEVGRGRTEISLLAFTMCGTPEFMAPEFCMSVGYDQGADWWALGCVLFEMYMGRNPFDTGGNLKRTFKDVCMIGMGKAALKLHPKFIEKFNDAAHLLQSCLTHASSRIGKHKDIREHTFFSNIDFKDLIAGKAQAPYFPTLSGQTDTFYFEQSLEGVEPDEVPPYNGEDDWCKEF